MQSILWTATGTTLRDTLAPCLLPSDCGVPASSSDLQRVVINMSFRPHPLPRPPPRVAQPSQAEQGISDDWHCPSSTDNRTYRPPSSASPPPHCRQALSLQTKLKIMIMTTE
ncbi:hypothetical protein H8959_010544 [Pygathrix nigripes]